MPCSSTRLHPPPQKKEQGPLHIGPPCQTPGGARGREAGTRRQNTGRGGRGGGARPSAHAPPRAPAPVRDWVSSGGTPGPPTSAAVGACAAGHGTCGLAGPPPPPSGPTLPPAQKYGINTVPTPTRLPRLRQGRSVRATHTTTGTHASPTTGEDDARISPKPESCGFKWADSPNKCARDPMQSADLSPKPCLMRLPYISYRIQ